MATCPFGHGTKTADEARTALRTSDLVTAKPAQRYAGDGIVAYGRHPLNTHGEEHAQMRKLLQPFFTARAVRSYQPMVERIVSETLDALEGRHSGDLVSDFAVPIPLRIMGELLEIPANDLWPLQQLTSKLVSNAGLGQEEFIALQRCGTRILAGIDPGSLSIAGAIVRASRSEAAFLPRTSATSLFLFLFGAGMDTTSILLAKGARHLMAHPGLLECPVETMLDTLLAECSPVQSMIRVATCDTQLSEPVTAGGAVFVDLAAANAESEPGKHLAFGYGLHRCLGAQLAWIEAELALPQLFGRFPRLQLAGAPSHREAFHLPSLTALPVSY